MIRTHNNREKGVALLTATIFLSVAVLTLSALTLRVVNQNKQVDQYVRYKDCFLGLEAAYALSKSDLEGGGSGLVGIAEGSQPSPTSAGFTEPDLDAEGINAPALPSMPGVAYVAYVDSWATDGLDNNGDGLIDGPEEDWTYTLYAFAKNGPVKRKAEVILKGYDVNVWRNAIFGGSGQAGGLINGNVSIHGSVHLLGNNIPEGGAAVSALELSGASLIHNNYNNMPVELRERIPDPPIVTFNGEDIETLGAKLRVKNGLVSMSGSSEIGEPDTAGTTYKETMDGTFVEDGWSGNSVADDGDRGDPTLLFSDNGWDEGYDLGDKVPFPVLADDWRDYYTGATVINPATGANYSHEEYFTQALANTPYEGDVLIKANEPFYYNAMKPLDPDPSHIEAGDSYILFDPDTNIMQINGQIQINGNLEITRGGGNDKSIEYTGRAAILAYGDVTLDTDLRTINSDGTTANSFPANNCLGIMASNNMVVGSLSQLQLMGAFYAQNTIQSLKQTTILGTFVSNYFDMGTNVPDIYQVPTLADNLPIGMLGAYPIMVMSQVSWREI